MGKIKSIDEKQFAYELGRLESIICMRTNFTGDPPYVGIEGLCLALNQALDERDTLRDVVNEHLQPSEEEKRRFASEHGVYL